MAKQSFSPSKRRTIGFLSTWSVYEGTTIDSYTHTLLQGIYAAAREQDCNLLIGCGVSLPGNPRGSRTAWAAPGSEVDFVPVGPWNTEGLIIIPDDLSDAQFEYVQDLIRSGYPIVLTTAEKPGPLVAVDNANGIHMAFDHLLRHGHRRIAFIAGKLGRGGDSAERLAAYRMALRESDIEADERLIAFGEHRREDGATAMQRILDSGGPFSAVLASNDRSALGAMGVLRAAGRPGHWETPVLDLVYLEPGGDAPDYLSELRQENLSQLDWQVFERLARRLAKPKPGRAVREIRKLAREEEEFESL
jgi:DNA-binding LacI/PurR family transcriptional regulator